MREAVPQTKPVPHELLVNVAGGLMTTPSDYLKLMLLMMDGRPKQPWQISASVAPSHADGPARNPRSGIVARSWVGAQTHPGFRLFEHSGSNYGIFHSLAVGNAQSGDAIAIFTNGANGSELADRIVREVAGLELVKFLV